MAVQGDTGSRLPPPPRSDLWTLPQIRTLDIERVRYLPPRKQIVAGTVIEIGEGVEIIVRTDGEIPMRALAAALYVGTAEVAEGERIDPTTYRFFVLDEADLLPGAPIRLGWAGLGAPAPDGKSTFPYAKPEGLVHRSGDGPSRRPPEDEPREETWWWRPFQILGAIIRWLTNLFRSPTRGG